MYTLEDIEYIFNKYNLKLLGNKIGNSKTKFTAIDKDGYLAYISLEFLKINNGSYRLWHKSNPYSIYNINLYLKRNNIKTYTISDEYISLIEKMKWYCSECGDIFEVCFQHIKNNKKHLCNKCSKVKEINNRRNNIEDVKRVFIKNGFTPLFKEVERNDQKVTALNEEGYLIYSTYNNVKLGFSSYIVHPSNPYTIYNVKLYIKHNNLNCELLSEEYHSRDEKLIFKCKCGNIFYTRWGTFISGKNRCDICSKRKSSLEYKTELFLKENNIKYKYQYKNKECKLKRALPIDFALFKESKIVGLIETDGSQHFSKIDVFGGEERFKHQQNIDKIKDDFAKRNNIPMLRIPYWEFKDEDYKDILNNFIKNII
ncbi:hypothetical protein [Clostridium sardiniense]|uniref:hypothetical protein n=1 Tax=Clostridium sardiniense TaxID=29369 RepID=UPI001957FDB0|nr:hypothetical protein [Clostridium sardiniense]MBM7835712.1 DNA-directed RNA polymerase subunit RPC12/RpoP [Clostridium sardiniense]